MASTKIGIFIQNSYLLIVETSILFQTLKMESGQLGTSKKALTIYLKEKPTYCKKNMKCANMKRIQPSIVSSEVFGRRTG